MNITLIGISLILVASVFLPFFLIDSAGRKGVKKMKKESRAEVLARKLNITEQEIWGNSFIGIARDQQKLLFIKFAEPEKVVSEIALEMVKNCEVESLLGTLKSGNKKEKVLERLDLKLSLRGTPPSTVTLNFYDSDGIYKEDFEQARAEKWMRAIQELMVVKQQIDRVA
jgi:hypothetical protein